MRSWSNSSRTMRYPLVNIQKAIENGHLVRGNFPWKMVIIHSKLLNCQRVSGRSSMVFPFPSEPPVDRPKTPGTTCCSNFRASVEHSTAWQIVPTLVPWWTSNQLISGCSTVQPHKFGIIGLTGFNSSPVLEPSFFPSNLSLAVLSAILGSAHAGRVSR